MKKSKDHRNYPSGGEVPPALPQPAGAAATGPVETPVRREGETMTEFAKRAIAAKAMAGRAEATGGSPPKALPYVFF